MTERQTELLACLAAAGLLGFAGGYFMRQIPAPGGGEAARLRDECARLQAEVDRLSARLAALDDDGPGMPQPPGMTRRQQRTPEADEPPVVDEQVSPDAAETSGRRKG